MAIADPLPAFDPERELLSMIEQTARLVAAAAALVASCRRIDVAGLERQVGLLCAKALDLPPQRAGFVRHELTRLAAKLDGLDAAMREQAR